MSKKYSYVVQLDYEPEPDESPEFGRDWIKTCVERKFQELVDVPGPITDYSVQWSWETPLSCNGKCGRCAQMSCISEHTGAWDVKAVTGTGADYKTMECFDPCPVHHRFVAQKSLSDQPDYPIDAEIRRKSARPWLIGKRDSGLSLPLQVVVGVALGCFGFGVVLMLLIHMAT